MATLSKLKTSVSVAAKSAIILLVAALAGAGCNQRSPASQGASVPNDLAISVNTLAPEPATAPINSVDPRGDALLATLALSEHPTVPADPTNRFADDARAAALGQQIFMDPRFSGRLIEGDNDGSAHTLGKKGEAGKISCAGCHMPEQGFSDFRTLGGQISLAAGWGRRRAPSLLDVAQNHFFMWDGRHDTLASQIFSVIESPVEMNSSRLYFAQRLYDHYRSDYEAIFGKMPNYGDHKRFPLIPAQVVGCHFKGRPGLGDCLGPQRGGPGDGAEFDHLSERDQRATNQTVINAGKAVAAFERHLKCGRSRFDEWVAGRSDVLTLSEQRGARLFVGKARCVSCHSGPYLSDFDFHNVGMTAKIVAVVFQDGGDRGAATGIAAAQKDPLNSRGKFSDGANSALDLPIDAHLESAFKTPMLRCLSSRPSYMHTGQIRTLSSVVDFFNGGGDRYGYSGRNELRPLGLTDTEKQDLVAFLRSLEGSHADRIKSGG